ncbi:putative Ubiquitin-like domain-containing protein [Helianthus annuus]|nr:putative Ubiquitin-like domain-containing protein [Helianthus annuus]
MEVKPFDTIQNVKSAIYNMEGIPHSWQRLIYGNKQLEDSHTLADYDVHHESNIYLVFYVLTDLNTLNEKNVKYCNNPR